MKTLLILCSLVVALAALGVALHGRGGGTQAAREPAFERVQNSGTLRCGYYVFPPATYRDANTNQLSGFSVDLMERIAANAGLKVDWAEEVTFGNWPESLNTGRVDAICTPLWPEIAMARGALFTRPHIYAAINAYVRGDDKRFTDLKQLNDPNVTILDQDGSGYRELILRYFPKAKVNALPATAGTTDLAMNVMSGKADVILWDENGRLQLEKTHPGALKMINAERPLRVMPFVFGVKRGDYDLQNLLDVGTQVMLDTGSVEELLMKWNMDKAAFLRVAPGYSR